MRTLSAKLAVIGIILIFGILATSRYGHGQQKNCCCAWMLWKVEIEKEFKSQKWIIMDAFLNYEGCKKVQATHGKISSDKIIKGEEVYRCFPDTFSPMITK